MWTRNLSHIYQTLDTQIGTLTVTICNALSQQKTEIKYSSEKRN